MELGTNFPILLLMRQTPPGFANSRAAPPRRPGSMTGAGAPDFAPEYPIDADPVGQHGRDADQRNRQHTSFLKCLQPRRAKPLDRLVSRRT